MDNYLWELFKKTGDLRYYLLMKEMENVVDEDRESKSDSDQ